MLRILSNNLIDTEENNENPHSEEKYQEFLVYLQIDNLEKVILFSF